MSFTVFRRGNACPLCESSSGKCKHAEGLVLCMSFTDEINVPGYKFVGRTQNDVWGKWVVDHGDRSEAEREAWRQQQQLRRQQRQAEEAQRRAAAMPAAERDSHYRRLLEQIALHPDDRADLHRRGITDEQIQRWGVKSVEQWQRLTIELPHTLPGVNLDGSSLNVGGAGYLCPILDVDGLLVGFQIRLRESEEGRYRWLTSKTKKRQNGPQPNLPSGELPLAVHRPQQITRKAIALVEGIGAKPFLAAQRLGAVTIGAAGGQFSSSPATLRCTVDRLAAELGTKQVEFFPDAGSPQNQTVLRQYRKTWRLLQRWGYSVEVAWWGQESKDVADIDELQDLKAINFLTVSQWEGIVAGRDKQRMLDRLIKLLHARPKRRKEQQQGQPQQESKSSIFEYAPGDRLQTWQQAIENGSKYVLDLSQTGGGKSFDAGNVAAELLGVRQLIYVSNQHRNPTTETLETLNGWVDLEARHAGLVREQTGEGSRLRRAKKGEFATATIAANCSRTNLLGALRAKNVQGADTASMICGSCPLREACTHAEGRGYGYLNQRRSALSSPKLRSHPDSLPDPTEYSFEDVALIWDEPEETLNVKHSVTVSLNDLQQTITALLQYPNLFEQLQPLFTALLSYLDGSASTGKFGIGNNDVLALLPDLSAVEISAIERVLHPNFGFLNTTEEYGVDLADLPAHLRKKFADRDGELAERAEGHLIKNWLPDLLRIAAGKLPGASLSLHRKTLTLNLPDSRHRSVIEASKAVVFLDATLSREDLALKLGCEADEIFVCRQQRLPASNLRILQVNDLGRMGMSRGEDQKRRAEAIVAHFQQQDPTTRVIDFKKFAEDDFGAWWRDSRGVNDFLCCKTLILIGTPCQNLADLQAEYAVITGAFPGSEDESFRAFVDRKIRAAMQQGTGRVRAHRRPEEQLTVVIVSDFDLELSNVEQVKASDITLDAAGKFEQFQIAARQAIETLKAAGEKLTQTAVAAISGYSQQYVSRHWRLLQTLLDLSNSKGGNTIEVDFDMCELVEATLAKSSFDIIRSLESDLYEWIPLDQWQDICQCLSQRAQINLISALLVALQNRIPLHQLEAIG